MQPFINIDLGGPAQPLLKVNNLLKHFPAGGGKALADQEIAVAVQKIRGNALVGQGSQGGRDRPAGFRIVVVADPRLEQIAQDVQGFGPPRPPFQEIQEQGGDGGAHRLQVQIGDEQRSHEAIRR